MEKKVERRGAARGGERGAGCHEAAAALRFYKHTRLQLSIIYIYGSLQMRRPNLLYTSSNKNQKQREDRLSQKPPAPSPHAIAK